MRMVGECTLKKRTPLPQEWLHMGRGDSFVVTRGVLRSFKTRAGPSFFATDFVFCVGRAGE